MAMILCVDDEPTTLAVLKEALERAGHRVVCVRNMDAALTVLARGEIDLVVSDYRMPGGTGLELLQEMQERGYDVPLVMVTGYGSIEQAVTAVKAGAVDYVTKPIRPKQDRKSTRLNSSHVKPSYAVFCLKKQNRTHPLA